MAFNFYGTFTTAQFELLKKFAKIQERDLEQRKKWLQVQLEKNGIFITEYDTQTNMPKSFEATSGSYSNKLLIAYKSLGGNPEVEMLLRTSDKPVFLTRGTSVSSEVGSDPSNGYSDKFTNGRRMRGSQRFDRDVGVQVEKLKYWQLESIKRKREVLEFKIKRALDLSDQLQREINIISVLLDQSGGASVDDQIRKVESFMYRTGASNIVQDLVDVFGLGIGQVSDPTYTPDYENKDSEELR